MRLPLAVTLASLLLAGACAGSVPIPPASPAVASPQPSAAPSVRPTSGDSPRATSTPAPGTRSLPPTGSTPTTSTAAASTPGPIELTIRSDSGTRFRFSPDGVEVPAGAEVALTFENLSTVPHNLTFGSPIDAATSTVVEGGTSETIEFTAPPAAGDYDFVCTIHFGMDGTLRVTD
jgi:plastocyanin